MADAPREVWTVDYLSSDARTSYMDFICLKELRLAIWLRYIKRCKSLKLTEPHVHSMRRPPQTALELRSQILRCFCRRSFRSHICFGQPSVDNKISCVDKAAFVAGQEDNRVSLLDRLAESSRWEMYFAAESLGLVIAKPVLQ